MSVLKTMFTYWHQKHYLQRPKITKQINLFNMWIGYVGYLISSYWIAICWYKWSKASAANMEEGVRKVSFVCQTPVLWEIRKHFIYSAQTHTFNICLFGISRFGDISFNRNITSNNLYLHKHLKIIYFGRNPLKSFFSM